MVYEIVIVGDRNDADYVRSINSISSTNLEKIKPLIKAIKKFKPYRTKSASGLDWDHNHNWPSGEYSPRTDLGEKHPHEIYKGFNKEVELLEVYVPPDIHSIESIYIYPRPKKIKLL